VFPPNKNSPRPGHPLPGSRGVVTWVTRETRSHTQTREPIPEFLQMASLILRHAALGMAFRKHALASCNTLS